MRTSAFLVVTMMSSQLFAQTMTIHLSDGSTASIPIAQVQKITFDLSGPTGISGNPGLTKKIKAVMARILPGPFGLEYTIEKAGLVKISVYNSMGQIVRVLMNTKVPAGRHVVNWDTKDDAGQGIGAGPYILSIVVDGKSHTKSLFINN